MIPCFLVKNKKNLLLSSFLIIFFSLTAFSLKEINKPKTTRSKASETSLPSLSSGYSFKKGVAGIKPFNPPRFNTTVAEIKASWYYNWSWVPFDRSLGDNIAFNSNYWTEPEFVPMFLSRGPNCGCQTESQKTALINAIVYRMNLICSKGFCNQGRYYLVGNEPEIPGQDLCQNSFDPVLDAVNCYGIIAKTIKLKDSTAKIIILGLGSDNTNFIRSFIQKWKNVWNGSDIADLSQVIRGWHFHDYGSYNRCPTDDQRARNLKTVVDQEMQQSFGKTINDQEIWVTEMGSLSPPNPSNAIERQKFLNLMECLVNVYEASPIVNRYAWFYAGDQTYHWPLTSLYVSNTSGEYNITDLGIKYGQLPAGPTATPTPPPDNCQNFANPIIDQKQEARWRYSQINTGWGYGEPLVFQPQTMGKLDKIELYVSGSGNILVKVVNQSGADITDTVIQKINQEGWYEFRFLNKPLIAPGNFYTILFRSEIPSDIINLYRGEGWKWAFHQYVMPCQSNNPGTSPTNQPPLTPTITPQPSPTPVLGNQIPVIITSGFLPEGYTGQEYKPNGKIFYVEGYDNDVGDYLIMKYYGPPPGISLKNCNQLILNNRKSIKCEVSGTIPYDAIKKMYYGRLILSDSNGGQTIRNVAIKVK